MKKILLLASIFICFQGFSQKKKTTYIEIRGTIGIIGTTYLLAVNAPSSNRDSDSVYSGVNKIIGNAGSTINAINSLSEAGWQLVSTVSVASDKARGENTSYILYYFKKEL